jgi:hypothetical protein
MSDYLFNQRLVPARHRAQTTRCQTPDGLDKRVAKVSLW